jgi:hypothetical protein
MSDCSSTKTRVKNRQLFFAIIVFMPSLLEKFSWILIVIAHEWAI